MTAVPRLKASLQVVMHHTDEFDDPTPLEALHRDAVTSVGAGHPMALLVECSLEEARSRKRAESASRAAWSALLARAERALGRDDTTLMSIRSFHNQYERRAGGDAERDAAPRRYAAEWEQRRVALGDSDYRTRIARANLAYALRERGTGDDLDVSRQMLVEEVAHRARGYGENDLFTWAARGLLAQTLIALAQRDAGTPAGERAAQEALGLATGLVELRRRRFGRFHVLTLKAQLLQVESLLTAGRVSEAKDELRYLQAASRRGHSALDSALVDYIDRLASSP